MRYADMLSRLKHDWPTEDQPAKPDAVLVFEPQVDGCEKWLQYSDMAETPTQIDGVYGLEFLRDAQPLPKEMVPCRFPFEGIDPRKNGQPICRR
jgi:hypothetical protein